MKHKREIVKNKVFRHDFNAYLPENYRLGPDLWLTEQFTLANFMYDKFVSSDCITSHIMEADIIFIPLFPFTTWWKETPKFAAAREAADVIKGLIPDEILYDRRP